MSYVGDGSPERLCDSFLQDGRLVFAAVRDDGTVVYANEAVRNLLGYEPDEIVGRNVLELLQPDDVERAGLALGSVDGGDLTAGITRFTALHKDGTWRLIEVFAGPVSDGVEELVGIYARSGADHVFMEEILSMLVLGMPRAAVLAPVCNAIEWRAAGSHLAISWEDEEGFHQVDTGLPHGLGGGDGRGGTPWADCRKARGADSVEGTAADLDADLSALAASSGVSEYWIRSVSWSDVYGNATVTVWTAGEKYRPRLHAYGMSLAHDLVELILRWTHQVAEMSRAAMLDPLTGLANRREFFAALDAHQGGALLYCDLDRFKPVNDRYGHAAGDALLRLVSRRIESCVRDGDVIARLGGDEFAVLCADATLSDAEAVANRVRHAICQPFVVDAKRVDISVSIGIAASAADLNEDVLGMADRALFEAKASGGARICQAALAGSASKR